MRVYSNTALHAFSPYSLQGTVQVCAGFIMHGKISSAKGSKSFNILIRVYYHKEIIVKHNAPTLIEIDGGVNDKNAKALVEAGADVLVAGNFVFKSDSPTQTISQLKKITSY